MKLFKCNLHFIQSYLTIWPPYIWKSDHTLVLTLEGMSLLTKEINSNFSELYPPKGKRLQTIKCAMLARFAFQWYNEKNVRKKKQKKFLLVWMVFVCVWKCGNRLNRSKATNFITCCTIFNSPGNSGSSSTEPLGYGTGCLLEPYINS